ncbi:hypothetical protein PN4B1_31110 [Paenibacillus naphthalenovorans]|nr:hypothetical protein PN4B1_31110 [Paenibacillus naphthalenovorans]
MPTRSRHCNRGVNADMPLIFGLGRRVLTMILEPGDLPVLTALFLPTGDREVLKMVATVFTNEGHLYPF